MKLKVIQVKGEATVGFYHEDAGHYYLYPDGTLRDVLAYFIFPKRIGDERQRGLQVIEQVALVKTAYSGLEGSWIEYNKWVNKRFINPSNIRQWEGVIE